MRELFKTLFSLMHIKSFYTMISFVVCTLLPNIIRVINPRSNRWEISIPCLGRMNSNVPIKSESQRLVEGAWCSWEDNIKIPFKKYDAMMWTKVNQLSLRLVAGCCKHKKQWLVSIRVWKYLE
jgi:hypothetical protein